MSEDNNFECQADASSKGEDADALRRQIYRAIAVAMQLQEFGHFEDDLREPGAKVFVTTPADHERFETACNRATEKVIQIIIAYIAAYSVPGKGRI